MTKTMKNKTRIGGKCITISEFHINAFAGLTLDFNPLHVDEEFAKKTRFKGRIAHGLLSLSLALGLISESVGGSFLYGFDKVRFLSPIKPGDTVCSQLVVNSTRTNEEFSLYYCTLTLKRGDLPVVVADVIFGREVEKK